MTEWKDPQERAEQEDRERDAARGYAALEDTRDKVLEDANTVCTELFDGVDGFGWQPACQLKRRIVGLLDRQAAITERELCAQCEWPGLAAQPDREALDALGERERRIAELAKERDHWRKTACEHAAELQEMWLKGADGEPVRIGQTVYGSDGRGWRVTGFRWGSSHPVQGVDGKHRRRDLKPSWLTHEKPDTWEAVLADLRQMDDDNLIPLGDGQYEEDTRHGEIAERIEKLRGAR